jgi:hypothetical protein
VAPVNCEGASLKGSLGSLLFLDVFGCDQQSRR